MNKNGCSVIVPTFNRKQTLKFCIESLLRNNFDNCEVIVVNDASTDGTKEYLNDLKNEKIKVAHNERNLGPGQARNIGIKMAQYDILAFIDDDCMASSDLLSSLMQEFENEKIGFVIGSTYYVAKDYKGYFPERIVQNPDASWPMTCNIAYRKSVLDKIGKFNTQFDSYANEDTELALRAVASGFYFTRAKKAVVYHQKSKWTIEFLIKSAKNLSVWPILKKKYPDHYLSFGGPVYLGAFVSPVDYFFILFFPILLPFLIFRYFLRGGGSLKIFFAKWPVYFLLRRYFIWREAVQNKIFMI